MTVRLSATPGTLRRRIVLLVAAVALGACGQIGPLYLPDQTDAPPETESQTSEESSAETRARKQNDADKPDSR